VFLDADDLWLPETLDVQLELAARHPESRMIVCDGIAIEDGRRVTERLPMDPSLSITIRLCVTGFFRSAPLARADCAASPSPSGPCRC